jgi:hypothetical protein
MKLVMQLKCVYMKLMVKPVQVNMSDAFPIQNGLKQEMLYHHCFSTSL